MDKSNPGSPGAVTPARVDSPTTSPKKEKPKVDSDDKVYTVATEKTIKSLMSEYKKRKQVHSMPRFVKATRSRPAPERPDRARSSDPVEQQIEEQQLSSIMKVGRLGGSSLKSGVETKKLYSPQ